MGDTIPITLGGRTVQADVVTGAVAAANDILAYPSVTGVISALNGAVTMSCPIAGAYTVKLTTPAGQPEFSGTLLAQSSGGAPKRWMRTGVAPLDVSAISFTGLPMGTRFYTFSGGQSLQIIATGYTGGQVQVTIGASDEPLYPIINGETQTSSVVALLNGRGFTATVPSTLGAVDNGSYTALMIRNTSAEVRGIWEARVLSTDVLGGRTPARYFIINNPTGTLPTTAAAIGRRGAAGINSVMAVTYGNLAALPTGTANTGYVPTNGTPYILPLEKTLEPGESQILLIQGVNPDGSVGGKSTPSILYGWREQNVN